MNIFHEHTHATENTTKFLSLIASHLSGRKEFGGLEYKILIMPYLYQNDHFVCVSEPDARCFKDRYSRKTCDIDTVCDHVCKYHMQKDIMSLDVRSNQIIYRDLIPGVYMYQKSITGKSRRWMRVPSLFDV